MFPNVNRLFLMHHQNRDISAILSMQLTSQSVGEFQMNDTS